MNPSTFDNRYRYQKITNSDTIRLILLQPSQELSAPLFCSVIHTTISECAHDIIDGYVALSYVWGNPNDKSFILIDGKRLDITTSLDIALRHIRDKHRVLRIWADGICINQRDVTDRNHQVGRMSSIYSTALHTVVFLGQASEEDEFVMKTIASRNGSRNPSEFEDNLLDSILANPWFGRVWVLQELVLSVDPWVQWGCFRVKWDDLCHFFYKGSWHDESYPPGSLGEHLTAMNNLRRLHNLPVGYKSKGASHLLEILGKRRGCGATDPRDLVYAHLGLVDDGALLEIPIEYSTPVVEVYERFIKSFFRQTGKLSFLEYVEEVEADSRRPDLPSWVPDWTVPFRKRIPLSTSIKISQPRVSYPLDMPGIFNVAGNLCGKVVAIIKTSSLPVNAFRTDYSSLTLIKWMTEPEARAVLKILFDFYILPSKRSKITFGSLPTNLLHFPDTELLMIDLQTFGVPNVIEELILDLSPEIQRMVCCAMTPEVLAGMVFRSLYFFCFPDVVYRDKKVSNRDEIALIQDKHGGRLLFGLLPRLVRVDDELRALDECDTEIFIFRSDNQIIESRYEALLSEKLDKSSSFRSAGLDLKCRKFLTYERRDILQLFNAHDFVEWGLSRPSSASTYMPPISGTPTLFALR